MSASARHHYVPQFYFRNFSSDRKTINLLHRASSQLIHAAPIRKQAQRRNFYLKGEIEKALSQVESRQAAAIRAILKSAEECDPEQFYNEQHLMWIWNLVTIQRSRTPFEAEKTARLQEEISMVAFEAFVQHELDEELRPKALEALDRGEVSMTMNCQHAALMRLETAEDSAMLISDMAIAVLRNQTDVPFIFSDSPVILHNQYLSRIKDKGTLGFQSPGLQIFVPVSPWVTVMLIDEQKYDGPFRERVIIDLTNKSDIGFLNAFQIHNSMSTIYYGDVNDSEYVGLLHAAHKHSILEEFKEFREFAPATSESQSDHRVENVYHTFEKQLNVHPKFTFLHCDPVAPAEYKRHRRDPEICKQFDKLIGRDRLGNSDDGVKEPLKLIDKDGNEMELLPRNSRAG